MSIRVMSDVFNVDTFWTWAVAQWSDSILADEMMALQEEHDCVVLELLLMGWLGRQHWAVSQGAHRQLADTASSWLNGVVIPCVAPVAVGAKSTISKFSDSSYKASNSRLNMPWLNYILAL